MNNVFHCIHIEENMYISAIVVAQSVESTLTILKTDDCATDWSKYDVYSTNLRTNENERLVSIMRIEKKD